MNENLNLVEILKDCPKGIKLYSPIFGEMIFDGIQDCGEYGTRVMMIGDDKVRNPFQPDGGVDDSGKCFLFPSKDQHDWSKFKVPTKRFNPEELKPFDKILIRNNNALAWNASLFSHIENIEGKIYAYTIVCKPWNQCIPCNDETKHLIGTHNDCPEFYKWWLDNE